eukprot:COSAG02_NODE_39130_length_420_cov_2.105919_1_plen_28_part_10
MSPAAPPVPYAVDEACLSMQSLDVNLST